jgi:hypothetical protein
MKLAEKLLEGYIQRLSQEEKEALFTRIVEHFFREMTRNRNNASWNKHYPLVGRH